jgi:hypothetical protein
MPFHDGIFRQNAVTISFHSFINIQMLVVGKSRACTILVRQTLGSKARIPYEAE